MRASSVFIFESPPLSAGDWPDDQDETEKAKETKTSPDVLQYKVIGGVHVRWL